MRPIFQLAPAGQTQTQLTTSAVPGLFACASTWYLFEVEQRYARDFM